MTRGERNHNPLNIRRSPRTHWLGEAKVQHDKSFVQFRCDLMGYRAAFRVLRTYIVLYHLTTIHDIIYRWAPPEDGNLTSAYIDMVAKWSGLAIGKQLSFNDEDTLVALVAAMARVESGITNPDMSVLHQAYTLAK